MRENYTTYNKIYLLSHLLDVEKVLRFINKYEWEFNNFVNIKQIKALLLIDNAPKTFRTPGNNTQKS